MTSHFTLPYYWKECVEPTNCHELVHVEEKAKTLNSYPREWVQAFIPNAYVGDIIILFNLKGRVHSSSGPAVIREDGTKEWWVNGTLHRKNAPAIERANGVSEWWIDGILEIEEGPITAPVRSKHQRKEDFRQIQNIIMNRESGR